MDDRNTKRDHASTSSASDHRHARSTGISLIRELRLVCKTFLEQRKKITLPFAVLSSAFLLSGASTAKAETKERWETMFERGDVRNGPFSKEAIDARGGMFGEFRSLFEKLEIVLDKFLAVIDWLNHLPENIVRLSVDLLAKLYELLLYVLQVPLFIFNNTYIQDASMVFAGASVLIVIILTMVEGMKGAFRKKYTDLYTIGKRFFVACVGAGAAPLLFEKVFQVINLITSSITKIGSKEMANTFKGEKDKLDQLIKEAEADGIVTEEEQLMIDQALHEYRYAVVDPGFFDFVNTAFLVGFDIMLIALVIPIFLQNGRRFFDLMCQAAITPLALSAWVFDDYRHLFDTWWSNLKKLSMTPLVYSVFIVLLGLFIFGTRNVTSGGGMFLKMIIAIGGLSRMADPPDFVKGRVDTGGNVEDSYYKAKKVAKDTYDTITLKKVRSAQFIKDQITEPKRIRELRQEHGVRSVRHLLKKNKNKDKGDK